MLRWLQSQQRQPQAGHDKVRIGAPGLSDLKPALWAYKTAGVPELIIQEMEVDSPAPESSEPGGQLAYTVSGCECRSWKWP